MSDQVISAEYDPSVSGLPGNVGDVVGVAGGQTAWVKTGTGVTDWREFPGAAAAVGVAAASITSEDSPYLVPVNVGSVFCALDDDEISVVLPAAADNGGREITVKYATEGDDPGAVAITVVEEGGLIDGGASAALAALYDSVTVVSDGSNWNIVATYSAP